MSYSSLIQKDNPAGFWSLDETSGTIAYGNGFFVNSSLTNNTYPYTKLYDGTYSSVVNLGLLVSVPPMTYGGKSSISILSGGTITIPSLNKMSYDDCGNSSSIEFWIKVNKTSSTEQVIMYKGLSSDPEIKISLLNDYVIFTIGTNQKKQSVAVFIDSVNKPLHIVASYSKSEISLIVNGVMKSEKLYNYSSYFSSTYTNNSFVFQKPSDINIFQIDSIALYSYNLSRQQALRHFVYGCGYNIPTEFVDANNGVYYNFSMDGHQDIKKYEFGGANPWSITESNNCVVINNKLSIRSNKEPEILFKDSYGSQSEIESKFNDSNSYVFDNDSYLILNDIGSIIPAMDSGWMFNFTKFGSEAGEQTLFIFKSNETDNFIKFTISTSGIKVYINSEVASATLIDNISGITDTFYVGFYITDSENINLVYLPSSGSGTISQQVLEEPLSLGATYLRIGSDDSWNSMENYETVKDVSSNYSLQKLNKIIAIHKDNISYYSSASDLEGTNFKHYYTATPNYLEKRFKIKSYATARIDIPLQSLAEHGKTYVGATRLEIGNPKGNDNFYLSVTGTTYLDGVSTATFYGTEQVSDRIVCSGTWLNKTNIVDATTGLDTVDMLQFNIKLTTDDLIKMPSSLEYFRLFSYPVVEDGVDKYLTCNASPGGNAAKIYLRNNEYSVPDLQEYPFFYNGYNSGLKIKNSYVKITQDYAFPSKTAQIISATKGSNTTLTLEDNPFIVGESVCISDVSDSGWNLAGKYIIPAGGISGNNVTIPLNSAGLNNYPTSPIDNGVLSIASGIQTVSFMLYVPSATVSASIIKIGSNQMSLSSTTLSLSGATIYVDKVEKSTIKINAWNHISIVLDPIILVQDVAPVDIVIGSISGTSEFYIDQLMFFDKKVDKTAIPDTSPVQYENKLVTNLYNLFSGEASYIRYSDGPKLIDNNNQYTITESSQTAYVINNIGQSPLFSTLKDATSDVTLTLNYKETSGSTVSSIKLSSNFSSGSNTMYASSATGVNQNSFLIINDEETTTYISNVSNPKISINPSQIVTESSGVNKHVARIYYSAGTNLGLMASGWNIDLKDYIKSTAKVTSINTSKRYIVVSAEKGKKVILKNIPTTKAITFSSPDTIITLSSTVNQSFDKNTIVNFTNLTRANNVTLNNKLKINKEYITDGTYILVSDTTTKLFQVNGEVDSELYNENTKVDIKFKLITGTDLQSLNNNVFYFGNNFNDAVKNNLIKKLTYQDGLPVWQDFSKFKDEKVISFTIPQSQE